MAKRVTQTFDQEAIDQWRDKLEIPGLVFRWVNPSSRERKGWGIWTPVTKDSEVGAEVEKQMSRTLDVFSGLDTDSNFFMRGRDSMLAYTTEERAAEHKVALKEKADAALKQVHDTEGAELRHTYIRKDK